jgi:hypothetical protein
MLFLSEESLDKSQLLYSIFSVFRTQSNPFSHRQIVSEALQFPEILIFWGSNDVDTVLYWGVN